MKATCFGMIPRRKMLPANRWYHKCDFSDDTQCESPENDVIVQVWQVIESSVIFECFLELD